MAKYLLKVSYTADGAKGLLKDGGSKRRTAAEQALKSAGARLEQLYFAFGGTDAYVILDAPDHATVAAASLAISASGALTAETVVLLSPEEIDAAAKKSVAYTAPGH